MVATTRGGCRRSEPRAYALLAKRASTDPANHNFAMLDNEPAWTAAELKEIENH
jgi:hypothetical protein